MNNQGQVVGSSYTYTEKLMRNMKDKVNQSLLAPPSWIGLKAKIAATKRLAEVGWSHAVLWEKGEILDLNDLIPKDSPWFLISADAINDLGQSVCFGSLKGSRGRGIPLSLVLTPIKTDAGP